MNFRKQIQKVTMIGGIALVSACAQDAPRQTNADTAEPVMDSLVSAQWLMQHLDDPDLVVIDATVVVESGADGSLQLINGRANYETGHIPTAVFADLLGELSDPESEFEFTLPSPDVFAATMGSLGVGDDSRVVIYDSMGMSWAARVWWMLRWIGFDRAALLDGGQQAWIDAGGRLSSEAVNPAARALTIKLRPELIADQEEVRASIDDASINLIDSLTPVHYRGEWTMYARPGHIPGAINVPVTALYDETGHLIPDSDIAGLFGSDKKARTITYCGGGIAAASNAFALTRIGFTDVAIYDGSLDQWTSDPDNPMEVVLDDFE